MPDWKKLLEAKIALARRGLKPGKPGGQARVPAGQTLVTDFPVLHISEAPRLSPAEWKLRVHGLVEKELLLDWQAFRQLPQIKDTSDFHCVTRWSKLDVEWEGVRASELLALAMPLEQAKYVTLHGYDRYTTNLPLEALLDSDVIIAHSVLGQPLSADHGGPVRLVVPKRYAWKSAKWLKAIELHAEDKPGFWEVRGYHNQADPWQEQRFSGN